MNGFIKFFMEFPMPIFPGGIYLFKVNNGNTRAMCEISSKLKTRASKIVDVVGLVASRYHR